MGTVTVIQYQRQTSATARQLDALSLTSRSSGRKAVFDCRRSIQRRRRDSAFNRGVRHSRNILQITVWVFYGGCR
jgi:hypothetical protein